MWLMGIRLLVNRGLSLRFVLDTFLYFNFWRTNLFLFRLSFIRFLADTTCYFYLGVVLIINLGGRRLSFF